MRAATLEELQFMQYLKDECRYEQVRPIDENRWVGLFQFAFTWAIIVGRIGDQYSYDDRWCYHHKSDAAEALEEWDGTGEPQGWHRHPMTGRRREMTDGVMEEEIRY